MKLLGMFVLALVIIALVLITPLALLWAVKQWQLILNDQLPILSLDAYITGLVTLCIIDGMRRIRVPDR